MAFAKPGLPIGLLNGAGGQTVNGACTKPGLPFLLGFPPWLHVTGALAGQVKVACLQCAGERDLVGCWLDHLLGI
ncbi:hypothetical protein IAQ61_005017 [Plenodomus lingam]|uniref:uncharacterized protein n=1 Tax=Leptosphaeria maculans TaxID=5022 RepID=UPI0033348EBA|nr:hypothetical protein IAQ61_005017 [Plenodomus lingam]